jgi:hypothetical protein
MYNETAWHAEGLRWIAAVLEGVARFLKRPGHEAGATQELHECVDAARLRAHLRGFQ